MIRLILPLGAFVLLLGLLLTGLFTAGQRHIVQSPLIDRPVPDFSLPLLHQPDQQLSRAELLGQPFILNVWGSWCPTCRDEHPWITRLGEESAATLVGLNWKDERTDALRWLDAFGDTWDIQLMDYVGNTAIDLGVYGSPETFLVDHEGIIRHKHIGAINAEVYADLVERIDRLLAAAEARS
ncbi:MAG: DsbE family thiol:disulfide interchange protein [Pseudomonadota bacterium]